MRRRSSNPLDAPQERASSADTVILDTWLGVVGNQGPGCPGVLEGPNAQRPMVADKAKERFLAWAGLTPHREAGEACGVGPGAELGAWPGRGGGGGGEGT